MSVGDDVVECVLQITLWNISCGRCYGSFLADANNEKDSGIKKHEAI